MLENTQQIVTLSLLRQKTRKGYLKYEFSMLRLYMDTATAVLSVILAFLIVKDVDISLLLYYMLSVVLITVIALVLKIRFSSVRGYEEDLAKEEGEPIGLMKLLILFCVLTMFIMTPLLLVRFLPSSVWFILLISFISGVSLSDLLFYLYITR